MRLFLFALLVLALGCRAPMTEPAGGAKRREALLRVMPTWMAEHHVPGVAVGFVADGRVAWVEGYGDATPDTVFEAASLGKPIFAHVVVAYAEEHRLDLEAPMAGFAPGLTFGALAPAALLSHSSGLVLDDQADRLRVDPSLAGSWHYSGPGFLALQRALERHAGTSLEALAQSRLFPSWGMGRTHYVGRSEAAPHDRSGNPLPKQVWANPNAASSLTTTARDMAHYLARLMDKAGEMPLQRMGAPHIKVDRRLGLAWGLGWALAQEREGAPPAWFHWGSNPGFKSFLLLDPTRRIGFVLLTNGDQGLELIEKAVGVLDPQPHRLFRFYMLHPDD